MSKTANDVATQQDLYGLPDDWSWTPLGDICDAINGRAFKSTEWREAGVPIIRIQNLKNPNAPFNYFQGDLNENHQVRSGDLLFAWSGTPGTSFGAHIWRGPDAALNQHIFKVQFDRAKIDTKYFCYALNQNVSRYVEQAQGGVGLAHITKSKFMASMIPVAPLDQQKNIVAEIEKQFSRLDEAVTNLKRVKANLKRYKAAVLKAAVEGRLVETEAERARREGRSFESGAQLLQRILETRRSQWQGKGKYKELAAPDITDLPELPEGWVWATFEQLSSELMNGYGKRSQIEGHPRIVLRLADISDGEISYADVRRINCTDEETGKYALAQNDLLILRVNGSPELVGRFVLVRSTNEVTLFCDHFIRVRCLNPGLSSWLNLYADSERFRRYIDLNKVSSAGQNTISQGTLLPHAVPLPPAKEQQNIITEIDRCFSLADEAETQVNANLQRAVRLRQAILGKAFSARQTKYALELSA